MADFTEESGRACPYLPRPRELVTDTATGRVGEFQAVLENVYWMRPIGGGIEYTADPRTVRPATQEEVLTAKVALANRRSRQGRGETLAPPAPVSGCDECEQLAAARRASRDAYDRSAVTDANVLMRRHLSASHAFPAESNA